VTLIKSDLIFI